MNISFEMTSTMDWYELEAERIVASRTTVIAKLSNTHACMHL